MADKARNERQRKRFDCVDIVEGETLAFQNLLLTDRQLFLHFFQRQAFGLWIEEQHDEECTTIITEKNTNG